MPEQKSGAAVPQQPVRMCLAALGGEGGGVLTSWIVSVAEAHGWPVQSTSVPGVAQRTGATTYYLEILPSKWEHAAQPVFALTPTPGFVDVVVATELLEAARAIEQGLVSPERTTLIASSHRSFTIEEKSDMADGRIDPQRILKAVKDLPMRSILLDFSRLANESGAVSSSVVFGAIAASGVLPAPRQSYEDAMRASGIAVESNLRGFALAYEAVTGVRSADAETKADHARPAAAIRKAGGVAAFDIESEFPAELQAVLGQAVHRLSQYQNQNYAERYLALVRKVLETERGAGAGTGFPVTRETAHYLAVMMTYDDIVRVAALKTSPERWRELYDGTRLAEGDVIRVTEFLKPGVEEFASILPPPLGRRLVGWARRHGKLDSFNLGMGVRTTSVFGFVLMRFLAGLRFYRPYTYRFSIESAAIERWIDLVVAATRIDPAFGAEVCACARIRKGYGSTHRRGTMNFEALMDRVVAPAVADRRSEADNLRELREIAMSDPDGDSMLAALDERFPPGPAGR